MLPELLITKMLAGDIILISYVEEEGFYKLVAFNKPEYKPTSLRTTVTRLEEFYKNHRAEQKANYQQGDWYYGLVHTSHHGVLRYHH